MAETDILNPQTGYWPELGDNPNPSYGFTRKTNANVLLAKTRLGSWYQRDNANAGYAFPMSFMLRPWTTMLRLKQFYEIGKSGYFTYIDYDGGGRHHVGRFTTEPNPIQMQNAKYNCQNLIFEEIPQARMLQYPADFVDWSRTINVVDDFLFPTYAYQGSWTPQVNPVYPDGGSNVPASYELMWAPNALGTDFAQIQYVGWGFKMTFRCGVGFGGCQILVDGQPVTTLNLNNTFSGGPNPIFGYLQPGSSSQLPAGTAEFQGPAGARISVTVTMTDLPLDAHRVKIVPVQISVPMEAEPFYGSVAVPALTVIV